MKKNLIMLFLVVLTMFSVLFYSFEVRKTTVLKEANNELNQEIKEYKTTFSLNEQSEEFIEKMHNGEHLNLLTDKAYAAAHSVGAEYDDTYSEFDDLTSELTFHMCTSNSESSDVYTSSCIYSFTSFHNQTFLVGKTLGQASLKWIKDNGVLKVDEFTVELLDQKLFENGE